METGGWLQSEYVVGVHCSFPTLNPLYHLCIISSHLQQYIIPHPISPLLN